MAIVLVPCLVLGLSLAMPQPADAARGGRMGGGSFRAPSMPRTMPRSGGGYRGGYGGGYRRGGGFGFPFIVPIFGFGGGGLFGLLILMAVAGVLVNALRGAGSAPGLGGAVATPKVPSKVNMIQLQVGLLAGAKALQDDLRSLAKSADTSSSTGLQRVLQESTLALLRQPQVLRGAHAGQELRPRRHRPSRQQRRHHPQASDPHRLRHRRDSQSPRSTRLLGRANDLQLSHAHHLLRMATVSYTHLTLPTKA